MPTPTFPPVRVPLSQMESVGRGQRPVLTRKGFRLTSGASYRWNRLDFDGAAFPLGSASFDLHRVDTALQRLGRSRGSLEALGAPATGGGIPTSARWGRMISFSLSLALLSYRWSDSVKVAFGAFYSRDLGEERVLPALGFILEPGPDWSLALTFPRVDWFMRPPPTGSSPRACSSAARDGTSPIRRGDPARSDLNCRSIRASVGVDRRLSGPGGPTSMPGCSSVRKSRSSEAVTTSPRNSIPPLISRRESGCGSETRRRHQGLPQRSEVEPVRNRGGRGFELPETVFRCRNRAPSPSHNTTVVAVWMPGSRGSSSGSRDRRGNRRSAREGLSSHLVSAQGHVRDVDSSPRRGRGRSHDDTGASVFSKMSRFPLRRRVEVVGVDAHDAGLAPEEGAGDGDLLLFSLPAVTVMRSVNSHSPRGRLSVTRMPRPSARAGALR